MFDLFFDIFACRDNALSRVDPRPKLAIALALILAAITSSRAFLPLGVAMGCLATMMALRVPLRLILLRLAAPLGVVCVLVLLQAFLIDGTILFRLDLAGFFLTATQEGLLRGALLASRVLGAVSVVLLLSAVTPAYRLFHALRWFRVPQAWVELALLVYRYIFVLVEQAADVAAAQRVRLGYSSPSRSLGSMGVLAGTVMARSLDQALRTHEAMMLRGYHGQFPFGPHSEMRLVERWSMFIVPGVVLAIEMIIEWGIP